ncbi:MAG: c-type cytochrome [Janthinobacterium lividum]
MNYKHVFLALALVGSVGSGLSLQAQHRPTAKAKTPAKTAADPTTKASITRGAVVYKNVCLTCHQADGYGVPNLNPPLIKTTYVLGDKAKLAHIVLAGLQEPVEINGDEYRQHMPAQAYLTDQQVADVLTYVRNSFGNKASAVQLSEVQAVRATLK